MLQRPGRPSLPAASAACPSGAGRRGPAAWRWGPAGRRWQMRLPRAIGFLLPE